MEAHQVQERANLAGALCSTVVGIQIRMASLNKMEELQQQMIGFYVEALGHKLDQQTTRNLIARRVGMFYEQCKTAYFSTESPRPANAQNRVAFETEAKQLLHHLDQKLQFAVREERRRTPRFGRNEQYDISPAIVRGWRRLVVRWVPERPHQKHSHADKVFLAIPRSNCRPIKS